MGGLLTAGLRHGLLRVTHDRLFLAFRVDSISGQIVTSFLIQQFFGRHITVAKRHKVDDEEERGNKSERTYYIQRLGGKNGERDDGGCEKEQRKAAHEHIA